MDTIILTGNPNVGKTAVFNRLTKSREHEGNWHGVTVVAKNKAIRYNESDINLVDLPGLYSLSAYSNEENAARDVIMAKDYRAVINICEVNNLPRNLYLTLQMLEAEVPLALAINMTDELKAQGRQINYTALAAALKLQVVPLSAKYDKKLDKLLDAALNISKSATVELPYLRRLPLAQVYAITGCRSRFFAIKLLEGDDFIADKLNLSDGQRGKIAELGDYRERIAELRYDFIDEIIKTVVTVLPDKVNGSSRLDRILLNKYAALPVFFGIIGLIFFVTFGSIGAFPMPGTFVTGLFESAIEFLGGACANAIEHAGAASWVVAMVEEGVFGGVGGVLAFLPQIVMLFLFLALLEDSGYMSRVAFMTDGFFRKVGLSGRAAFTMIMGFGCTASAVLTSRNLEDKALRNKTVMLTSFMSCGARLPVYAVVCGAFFGGSSAFVIFSLYLLGIAIAMLWSWILEHTRFRCGDAGFIMEMPPYRLPTVRRVARILWENVRIFLIRVGTLIFSLNIIIWLLANFSFTFAYVGAISGSPSMMELAAGFIAPLFAPLGFGNWQAITALLSGLVAKESVVAVLESVNAIGGEPAVFDTLSALSFLVFTLLYIPCFAALAAISREAGHKRMLLSVGIMLSTAYIMSLAVYWLGRLFALVGGGAILTIVIAVALIGTAVFVLVRMIVKRDFCPGCKGGCVGCEKSRSKTGRKSNRY